MNTSLMPLNLTFILNRIIWSILSIVVLWYTFQKFEFTAFLEKKKKRLKVISDDTAIIDYNQKAPEISWKKNKLFTFSQCLTISFQSGSPENP